MELFYGCRENEFDEILDEIVNETSLGDIISELGYGCTVDASHCNEVLSLFLPLTEATLSRLLGTIARMYAGREDNQNCCSTFYCAIGSSATLESTRLSSWNVNVLVDSINQLVSLIKFKLNGHYLFLSIVWQLAMLGWFLIEVMIFLTRP